MAVFKPSTSDPNGNLVVLATENYVNEEIVNVEIRSNFYTDTKVSNILITANAYADGAMQKAIQDILPFSTELLTDYDKTNFAKVITIGTGENAKKIIFRDEEFVKSGDNLTLQASKSYTLQIQGNTIQTANSMIDNASTLTLTNANLYTDAKIIKITNDTDTKISNLDTTLSTKINSNTTLINDLEAIVDQLRLQGFTKEDFVAYFNEFSKSIYLDRLAPTVYIDDYIQRFRFDRVTNSKLEIINHHKIDTTTSTTMDLVQHDSLHNGVVWRHHGNLDTSKNTYTLWSMKNHKLVKALLTINEDSGNINFGDYELLTQEHLNNLETSITNLIISNADYIYTEQDTVSIQHRADSANNFTILLTGIPNQQGFVRNAKFEINVSTKEILFTCDSIDDTEQRATTMFGMNKNYLNLYQKKIIGLKDAEYGGDAVNKRQLDNEGTQIGFITLAPVPTSITTNTDYINLTKNWMLCNGEFYDAIKYPALAQELTEAGYTSGVLPNLAGPADNIKYIIRVS